MDCSAAESCFDPTEQSIAQQRAAALEQLQGFWRALEYAFQERFDDLARVLAEDFRRVLETERAQARRTARRELAAELAQAARRLRQSASFEDWSSALLDLASRFAPRVLLLTVEEGAALGVAARGLGEEGGARLRGLRAPLARARALAAAVESGETVVAQRSREELSEALAGLLGESNDGRVWLVPAADPQGVAALLCAVGEQEAVDLAGLELAAALAGFHAGIPPRESQPALRPSPPREPPPWSQLSQEDRELHLRAQRFARVQVAEMRLYRSEAVRKGRAARNLYAVLKPEIDAARRAYREQFLDVSPTMVDYLHQELVRTLAHEDAALLGEDYPGPLV